MGQQTIMQSMKSSFSLDENEIDRRFPNQMKLIHQLNQGILSQTAVISIKNSLFVLRAFETTLFKEEEPQLYESSLSNFQNIRSQIISQDVVTKKDFLGKEVTSKNEPLIHTSPILDIIETSSKLFILRQYYYYNLKERMYKLPYLTYTEKLFIIFQLLFAVSELHEREIVHGDIKLENIMLTSNGSVFLVDIASYKPGYIPMDDSTAYTFYFGSAKQSLKTCNLAPERLVEGKDSRLNSLKAQVKKVEMDIFSLGCVITELLLEEYLFDYTKLLEYKNGKMDISKTLLKIKDDNLRLVISRMLEIDPNSRISLIECFRVFADMICPISIPRALIHFNTLIIKTSYWQPDMIIGNVYKHWKQIWKLCYGEFNEDGIPKLYNKLNYAIIHRLITQPDFKHLNTIFETPTFRQFSFIFDLEPSCSKLVNEDQIKHDKRLFTNNNNDKTALLFINYILQNLPFTQCESTKLVGMEMLKCFSSKLTDIEKIQIITPYFKPMLTVQNNLTRLTALHYLIDILNTINFKKLKLSPLDYKFFHDYLSPAIFKLVDKDSMLIMEFLSVLESIIDLEKKFREVERRSRMKEIEKRKHMHYNEHVDGMVFAKDDDDIMKSYMNDENEFYNNNNINDNINNSDDDNSDSSNDECHIHRTKTHMPAQSMILFNDKSRNELKEINNVCDGLVKKFKARLFSVIQNIFNKQDDIDMLQVLIRKLPILITYYISDKADEIFCFCINIFNKKEWILLKEILTVFPFMLDQFDKRNKSYRTDLINCIEMILPQNINEHIIYELIQVLRELFKYKNETHSIKTFLPLFKQLIPFHLHPNNRIRNDVIQFTFDFINQLNPIEIFIYTYEIFKLILQVPVAFITKDKIEKYLKHHMCRTTFEFQLGEYKSKYYNNTNQRNEDEGNNKLITFVLDAKKMSQMSMPYDFNDNNSDSDNDDNVNSNNDIENYCFNRNEYNNNNKKQKLIPLNVSDKLIELYKSYDLFEQDEKSNLKFFIEKLHGVCEIAHDTVLPPYISNTDLYYEDNRVFGMKDFKSFLLVKKLNILIKLSLHSDMFNKNTKPNNKENDLISSSYSSNLSHFAYQANSNFITWRPQGQLITSITHPNNIPIEKLIQLDINTFMSVDSNGDAYSWKITTEDNNIYSLKHDWKVTNSGNAITFNSTILNGDKHKVILASKNKLIKYSQSENNEGMNKVLLEMNDEYNYITSACYFEKTNRDKLNVLFSTVDCKLNMYDPRMKTTALVCELPKERGIVSCISNGFNEQTFNVGTLGGYIMKYDARLNSISSSLQYYNNKPIVGVCSYTPIQSQYHPYKNISGLKSKYLLIWTGSDEHDIALWDTQLMRGNTIMPSVLFRTNIKYVNQDDDNDEYMNVLDIPEITKINDYLSINSNDTEIIEHIKKLAKYTWVKYASNEYKKIITHSIPSDFYNRSNYSVWNSCYIYNNNSTAQSVISPMCNDKFENPYYLISAGNDKTIRYWDVSYDYLYGNSKKNVNDLQGNSSYVINAPCLLSSCKFSKLNYENTIVLQSNEEYEGNEGEMMVGEGFNGNGNMYLFDDNEFDRIADAAHENIITSILPINCVAEQDGMFYSSSGSGNKKGNLLVSGSWDGMIKIWK